jgi:hypothetical protein
MWRYLVACEHLFLWRTAKLLIRNRTLALGIRGQKEGFFELIAQHSRCCAASDSPRLSTVSILRTCDLLEIYR